MLVTLAGIETLDKMLHSQNAWFPILVTPFEIVIPPNLLQLTNAPLLILVTLEEIVTKVMLWQFWNALIPIVVTVKALIVAGMLTVPLSVLVYPVIVTWLLLPDQMRPAAVVPVMVWVYAIVENARKISSVALGLQRDFIAKILINQSFSFDFSHTFVGRALLYCWAYLLLLRHDMISRSKRMRTRQKQKNMNETRIGAMIAIWTKLLRNSAGTSAA